MKKRQHFIALIGFLLIFILGNYRNVDAQENLAQEAYAIFERNCLNCHGQHGAFTEEVIIEHTALIENGTVIPGKPGASEFYQRLIENAPEKRMPLGQPPLPPTAIDTIRRWILAGAPDWGDTFEPDGPFITPKEMLDTIESHVQSLAPFDRSFARYFTLTHLYNAGESAEALHAYRRALSKLVNSLSWGLEVIKPEPVNPEETIFYIDLRHYEWDVRNDGWTQIEQAYPYSIAFDAPTQTTLREKLTRLREEMNCEVPFVHGDWFLATASLPPLYHDILDLPQTDRELEARLEVDVVRNIQNAPGVRVWRAGFNDSGVSNNNRVVERHISRYGAYWKSYDFAGSVDTQNIFTHPLSFMHDGGEIVFNLPNGLQAYYLADAAGTRLDAAPINIVSNPAANDPTVRNGLSCIGCHTKGMKTFEDQVRPVVEKNANPPFDKAHTLRLYAEKSVMDGLLSEDTERYKQALEATGGVFGGIEPIQRFHEAFQGPLDAAYAAAAVGLETEGFLEKIRESVSLQNLGLLVLEGANGSVKRDAWTSKFSEVVFALDFPEESAVIRVVPQTKRIPGESVYIPDPNLRAAIAEALGKAPGASITSVEIATLEFLEAENKGINDLTGLEFATNLDHLRLENNLISNLSPLAELIKLNNLKLARNLISDISPLARLINLDWLGLAHNSISDISPLAGLIKLGGIKISDNLVSDLSPLSGLISLDRLDSWANSISDLSPLAGLTKLRWIHLGHNEISDLSPLAGLINLEWLHLGSNTISDVSPLAGLSNLEELYLCSNTISDVSSLAELRNLERLELDGNAISDVLPLAKLSRLETLILQHNSISDLSPLERLRENTDISWYENPGFPRGGPKIEGPWLWVLVPGEHLDSTDLLAEASGGTVTEQHLAARGATEGKSIGDSVWSSHKIGTTGGDNINELTNALGWGRGEDIYDHVVYGSVILDSPKEQRTIMYVGSNDGVKVWLNGELVHEKLIARGAVDYQDFFPVTLKESVNVLLVAVDNRSHGKFSGYFGFEPGTEYTLSNPGVGYAFSEAAIHVGDMFTLDLRAEDIHDLAGWQFDIAFDPAVLEVLEVNEGDFLKTEGGTTFFQQGTIDNTAGKIAGLSALRLRGDGVSGTGPLLSVTFMAKIGGETQLALSNFQFGSITGWVIPAGPHEVVITVEGQLTIGDVNRDGQVSILDMILVARHLGETAPANSEVDINGDGVINILDIIFVAQNLGESTASPAAPVAVTIDSAVLDPAMIQAWITRAQTENDGSVAFQQGIVNLQQLLASLIPEKTVLLANYPNPFNPETWIPYQLSEPSEVTVSIYAVSGTLVRTLALGHQYAGIYQTRSRAVYWDGKNDVGESVASGIYFYTLTIGDVGRSSQVHIQTTATRKMLIRK